jgi:hypothetical protein
LNLGLQRGIIKAGDHVPMKQENKLKAIETEVWQIKQRLLHIEEMRPGSLTVQYRRPKDKQYAFYQLSYTHNMKSRSNYIRKVFLKDLKSQIKNYRLFKSLTKRWVDLAIQHSQLKIDLADKL